MLTPLLPVALGQDLAKDFSWEREIGMARDPCRRGGVAAPRLLPLRHPTFPPVEYQQLFEPREQRPGDLHLGDLQPGVPNALPATRGQRHQRAQVGGVEAHALLLRDEYPPLSLDA